jgi:hypothetical protein
MTYTYKIQSFFSCNSLKFSKLRIMLLQMARKGTIINQDYKTF